MCEELRLTVWLSFCLCAYLLSVDRMCHVRNIRHASYVLVCLQVRVYKLCFCYNYVHICLNTMHFLFVHTF